MKVEEFPTQTKFSILTLHCVNTEALECSWRMTFCVLSTRLHTADGLNFKAHKTKKMFAATESEHGQMILDSDWNWKNVLRNELIIFSRALSTIKAELNAVRTWPWRGKLKRLCGWLWLCPMIKISIIASDLFAFGFCSSFLSLENFPWSTGRRAEENVWIQLFSNWFFYYENLHNLSHPESANFRGRNENASSEHLMEEWNSLKPSN